MDPDPLSSLLPLITTVTNTVPSSLFNAPTIGSIIAFFLASVGLSLSAFFSGSEMAFFSLTPTQREDINDTPNGKKVNDLLNSPEILLATILIANNFINVMIVILCNYGMNIIFNFDDNTLLNFVVQTVILTFLILLFGEILPKLYATNNSIRFAKFAASGVSFFCSLFRPISKMLVSSTIIVNKMVTAHADTISKEDLSQALELTNVKANDEKELLEGILKFGGTTVTEVMRPRVDIEDININCDFNQVREIVLKTGYSRLPVYEDSPDNIKGILYAKDLLPYINKKDSDFNWQHLLRDAYFVPETRMINDLLEDFRTMKIHMAIVVDEFGGTRGIVTLEDVLEEIVGDIDDEYDTEEKLYQQLPDGSFIFEGKTLLNDFYKITGLSEENFENISEEIETVAGLMLQVKGDFPQLKEPIIFGPCQFTALEIEKHRISKVRVVILFPEKEPDTI